MHFIFVTNGVHLSFDWEKESFSYTAGYTNDYVYVIPFFDTNNPPVEQQTWHWAAGSGGGGSVTGPRAPGCVVAWDNLGDGARTNAGYWCGGQFSHVLDTTDVQHTPARVFEANLADAMPVASDSKGAAFTGLGQSSTKYRVGGRALPGEQSFFRGWASVDGYTIGHDYDGFYSDRMEPAVPLPMPAWSGFYPIPDGPVHYSKMSILGVTLDENYVMYKLVPVGATLLTTVLFTADTAPAKAGVQIPQDDKIRIFMKKSGSYEDITEKTNVVWIGERIDLICKFKTGNTGGVLTNFNWTVPPTYVSNFITLPYDGRTIPVPSWMLTTSNVNFCWVDALAGGTVKCDATVAGLTLSSSASFIVNRPKADFVGRIVSTIHADVAAVQPSGVPPGMGTLRFGSNSPGIIFIGAIATNGLQVESQWRLCQTLATVTRFKYTNGTVDEYTGYGLDGGYPYGPSTNFLTTNGFVLLSGDRPFNTMEDYKIACNRSDSFITYLMFNPQRNDSIDVPIKLLTWQWSGLATNAAGSLSLLSNPTNAVITSMNVNTITHPVWTNTIIDATSMTRTPVPGNIFP